MDKSEELKALRWLDGYMDGRAEIAMTRPVTTMWNKCKPLVTARIAELTKDERVAVTLTRGDWERIKDILGSAGIYRPEHRPPVNRFRAQLEAKANE